MRLVIDISEDDYGKVQDGRASVSMMRKAIRNGTPLDKISAEIAEEQNDCVVKEQYDTAYGLELALGIIDKYKGESEDNCYRKWLESEVE
jgi:hypothetical protein